MKRAVILLSILSFACSGVKGINTANPDASPEAKKLLTYLARLPERQDNRVISGQHAGALNRVPEIYDELVAGLHKETGKWVGLISVDYGQWWQAEEPDRALLNRTLLDYWNSGGLVSVSYHVKNPWTGGHSWEELPANLEELITPGTGVNKVWMAELDRVAEALAELRDNGVVVLWRPFHEMTGDWFWWCTKAHPGNPEPFKKMWIHMFDYFTKTKKLDNLLWVYSASNRRDPPPDYCYPGDSYVDIVGQDIYSDSAEVSGYENLLALGKPFCLSEFGKTIKNKDRPFDYLVLIEKIKHKYPDTIYWLSWDGPYSIARNLNAEALLNDPWVITRDELDWK